jgi:hypothetical protein
LGHCPEGSWHLRPQHGLAEHRALIRLSFVVGARNRAIGELVLEVPLSLVADALGYSAKVTFLHADKAAEP